MTEAPLSVVIPTLNAAATLPKTLASLAPGTVEGLVREVIVSDGDSNDRTREIADATGAIVVSGPPGRGRQLARGAKTARGRHLLFLHADTVLEPSWVNEAAAFISGENGSVAVFRLAFDESSLACKIIAGGAMWRTRLLKLPYGDQGVLVARDLYQAAGGYRDMAMMEDVEFIDRLTRIARLVVMKTCAVTSAEKYRRDGHYLRAAKNIFCLAMYRVGVPADKIARLYR